MFELINRSVEKQFEICKREQVQAQAQTRTQTIVIVRNLQEKVIPHLRTSIESLSSNNGDPQFEYVGNLHTVRCATSVLIAVEGAVILLQASYLVYSSQR